jgi:dTDP-4-dehydrorhamnose reductase
MSIFLTGGSGQFGRCVQYLSRRAGFLCVAPTHQELDITRPEELERSIAQASRDHNIKAFIHSAAMTGLNACENDPGRAHAVNAHATEHIARICSDRDIPLVYISTDYVFDGTKQMPYEPDDEPAPLNAYGRSKLAGENAVIAQCDKYYILRFGGLFDERYTNEPSTVVHRALNNEPVSADSHNILSPTYAFDAAIALFALLGYPIPCNGVKVRCESQAVRSYGTYHIANIGYTSWYRFTCMLFDLLNIDVPVREISGSDQNGSARRPRFSALSVQKLHKCGIVMPTLDEALVTYVCNIDFSLCYS